MRVFYYNDSVWTTARGKAFARIGTMRKLRKAGFTMYTIGVDLGGTNIAIGIVNEKYEIVRKGSVPTKP